jgi:Beta-propeller repeat
VKYHAVYPGVDLVYYGNQRQLEHDFIVAPGADPGLISLRLEGAKKLSLDLHGDLVLKTQNGEVRLQKPMVYQEVGGVRREIGGGYELKGKNQVGFEVATYDVTKPLVIDPTLVYATYLGGSGSNGDQGQGIAVDSVGSAYVTGFTFSTNFPTTTGAFQTAIAGPDNVFVSKLNAAGSALVYSTYLGGSGGNGEAGYGIAVDSGARPTSRGLPIPRTSPPPRGLPD